MGQLSNSKLKAKYLKSSYEISSFFKNVYYEDFIDGIYCESNKADSKKTKIGESEFFRVKCGFEGIDMMDPFIYLLMHNFSNHIIAKHPDMDKWKILAVISEPDVVYFVNNRNRRGKIYFIEREIEGVTARVVVNRNKQGILYVVTAYIVESNLEKETNVKEKTERQILYTNLV